MFVLEKPGANASILRHGLEIEVFNLFRVLVENVSSDWLLRPLDDMRFQVGVRLQTQLKI